jgi:hypothetical protein
VAKRQLRAQTTWSIFVPPARTDVACGNCGNPQSVPPGPWVSGATRDFENNQCDTAANQGYGVVLNLAGFPPWENVNTLLGQSLDGSFTIWVRRPTRFTMNGVAEDDDSDAALIVTSEGTAPYRGAAAGANVAIQRRAVRVLEIQVTKIDPGDCENSRGGQAGNGALGSNFDACQAVSAEGIPGPGGVAPNENSGVQ